MVLFGSTTRISGIISMVCLANPVILSIVILIRVPQILDPFLIRKELSLCLLIVFGYMCKLYILFNIYNFISSNLLLFILLCFILVFLKLYFVVSQRIDSFLI